MLRLKDVLDGKHTGPSSRGVYTPPVGDAMTRWEPFYICRALWFVKTGELIDYRPQVMFTWHLNGPLAEMHDFARHMMFKHWPTAERKATLAEIVECVSYAYRTFSRLGDYNPPPPGEEPFFTAPSNKEEEQALRVLVDRAFFVDGTKPVSFGQELFRQDGKGDILKRVGLRELTDSEYWSVGAVTNTGLRWLADKLLAQEHAFLSGITGQVTPAPTTVAQPEPQPAPALMPTEDRDVKWWHEFEAEKLKSKGKLSQAEFCRRVVASGEARTVDAVKKALQRGKKEQAERSRNGGCAPKPGVNTANDPFNITKQKKR